MKRIHLLITATIIWGIPGITLTIKGISAYLAQPKSDLWWLLLITLFVLTSFFFIFRKIVNRYSDRIINLPEPNNLLQTFPFRGWFLLLFMMGLGISLKYIPNIPLAFIACFYSGLGPMLILSAIKFLTYTKK